ncbi:DUF732 domain-containing protein [Hoyosella altamirensis]|uniref:DUF732 domain-containing protein n=1 Tax=Hoyosella altamirensis TaxID=616997 RepID=A0A839RR47_9ACTN|nr:DUF732 domain-containing protein [Hoyosella altamirensis]MBB3038698.1 hypothetical protein [Hoyosella altamirensis]
MPRRHVASSRRTLFGALVFVAAAIATSACGGGDDEQASANTASDSVIATVEPEAASPMDEDRAQDIFAALDGAGVKGQSPATTLQLVRGICVQIEAGSSGQQILDNLQSVTSVMARETGAGMTGTEIAEIYVEAAKTYYCA